jgi:hypothetical protein
MSKWKFEYIETKLIVPAEENANSMTEQEFNKLIHNIQKSGGLSSAITCYKKENGSFVIISGHHRFKACVKLSFVKVPVIYALESDLEKDEIIALQLSHNSLHGQDDKGILKRMFNEIQSIDFKFFANIDIDEVGSIKTDNFSFSAELIHYTVSFVLYKEPFVNFAELLNVTDDLTKTSDLIIIADGNENENKLLELIKKAKKEYNIKSSGVALSKIIELAKLGLKSTKSTL